jgi:hypothetical protein
MRHTQPMHYSIGRNHASILLPLALPTAVGLIKLESLHIKRLKAGSSTPLLPQYFAILWTLSGVYPLGSGQHKFNFTALTTYTDDSEEISRKVGPDQSWIHTTSISPAALSLPLRFSTDIMKHPSHIYGHSGIIMVMTFTFCTLIRKFLPLLLPLWRIRHTKII